jgi:hypothetical protein
VARSDIVLKAVRKAIPKTGLRLERSTNMLTSKEITMNEVM